MPNDVYRKEQEETSTPMFYEHALQLILRPDLADEEKAQWFAERMSLSQFDEFGCAKRFNTVREDRVGRDLEDGSEVRSCFVGVAPAYPRGRAYFGNLSKKPGLLIAVAYNPEARTRTVFLIPPESRKTYLDMRKNRDGSWGKWEEFKAFEEPYTAPW